MAAGDDRQGRRWWFAYVAGHVALLGVPLPTGCSPVTGPDQIERIICKCVQPVGANVSRDQYWSLFARAMTTTIRVPFGWLLGSGKSLCQMDEWMDGCMQMKRARRLH